MTRTEQTYFYRETLEEGDFCFGVFFVVVVVLWRQVMIRTSSSHSICVRKKKKTALEKTAPESNKQSGERRFASPAPPILQTHRKKVTNQFVFQSSSNKNTEHTKPISFFLGKKKKKKNPTSCQEYALITTFFFIYIYILLL